jgi:Uma2 family endonuclease
MSLDEYLALPEEKPYLEWWDGVVLQKAVANRAHSRLAVGLIALLLDFERSVGGEVGTEMHTWFEGRGYRLPDVSYWAPGRPIETERGYGLPPTLAIEIRSPGNTLGELREKCRQMRANGVDVCWLVLPDERAIEVFDAANDGSRLTGHATVTPPQLPGFELSLPALFAVLGD